MVLNKGCSWKKILHVCYTGWNVGVRESEEREREAKRALPWGALEFVGVEAISEFWN